ncbi:hypothetical protein DL765_009925 [Monosporascus sp. GIB2]|nr:hypothetical protein DL765_009925 [Monosporascus sp. GIB2]
MPTRFSKTRKHRGHVSAGHGRVGKHRNHPGGRGMAGGQSSQWNPSINIDKLCSLLPEDMREKYLSGKSQDTVPVIDLLNLGYSKLLGKGRLPETPFVVRAKYVSKAAERKIVEAGGAIQLVA